MVNEKQGEIHVSFNNDERVILLRLLEESLVDIHAESRRTESPGYQQQMHRQEAIIRSLKEKVQGACP